MSSLMTLARPYAKAAFELARDEQALARWGDRLQLVSSIVADASMTKLLESPDVSGRQAVTLIAEIAGVEKADDEVDDRFRNFLSVLAANDRLSLVPQITSIYRGLREEAEKRLSVKVVSAIPLDENQAARMREALARRFDCEIVLENEIDADVIGGAVVYAGDQVIDGSLRGRLQKLSNSLAN